MILGYAQLFIEAASKVKKQLACVKLLASVFEEDYASQLRPIIINLRGL